ncbi:MAG: hypothetical protein CK425_04920 [Parachlamydia sp.]|nr:MAG: hypothetical protein CK425_04920 [Parachlamydia sp.]
MQATESVGSQIMSTGEKNRLEYVKKLGTTDLKILKTVVIASAFTAGYFAVNGAGSFSLWGRVYVITAETVTKCRVAALVCTATNSLLGVWQENAIRMLGTLHESLEPIAHHFWSGIKSFIHAACEFSLIPRSSRVLEY